MPSSQSASVLSGAIRKFFQPLWGSVDAEAPAPVAVPPSLGPDELLPRLVASLLKTGRQATALSMIERACQAKPLLPEYHHSRGLVLQACRRDAEALAAFELALSLYPDFPEALASRQRLLGL